jgi:hypothetical protein
MVNIVEDWEEMEHYAGRVPRGTKCAHQTLEKEGKGIRVLVGKYGYENEFKGHRQGSP